MYQASKRQTEESNIIIFLVYVAIYGKLVVNALSIHYLMHAHPYSYVHVVVFISTECIQVKEVAIDIMQDIYS